MAPKGTKANKSKSASTKEASLSSFAASAAVPNDAALWNYISTYKSSRKFSEEFEQFCLESWSAWTNSSSVLQLTVLCILFCEYFANGLHTVLIEDSVKFRGFMTSLAMVVLDKQLSDDFLYVYVQLCISMIGRFDEKLVESNLLRYFSLPIWESLSKTRLEMELSEDPDLEAGWKSIQAQKQGTSSKKRKTDATSSNQAVNEALQRDSQWFPALLNEYTSRCMSTNSSSEDSVLNRAICEKLLEFLIDLLSQLPTRRFVRVLVEDKHLVTVSKFSPLFAPTCEDNDLLCKLLQRVDQYLRFEVDDHTGAALTPGELMEASHVRITQLQQVAYALYPEELKDLIHTSMGEINKETSLRNMLSVLTLPQLISYAQELQVMTDRDEESEVFQQLLQSHGKDFLMALIADKFLTRERLIERVNLLSLYPNEQLLWDAKQIPRSTQFLDGVMQCLALPKLGLQYLSVYDYLLRNFQLFQLESAYEIREDLTEAIKRMGPKQGLHGKTLFDGWARMAIPIASITVDEVAKPRLGEIVPACVNCSVKIDLAKFRGEVRIEWESFRARDVVFMVCIERPQPQALERLREFEKERKLLETGKKTTQPRDFEWSEEELSFASLFGVKYVRCGEVFEFRDEQNVILNDPSRPDERPKGRAGDERTLRLHLDPAQYYTDTKEGRECYDCLNLLIRRDPRENNFKTILSTIRDLINTAAAGKLMPSWLHEVFLGYGDPESASFRSLRKESDVEEHDYVDTFLDAAHVLDTLGADVDNVVFESTAATNGAAAGHSTVEVKKNGQMQRGVKLADLPPLPYVVRIANTPVEAPQQPSSGSKKGSKRKAADAAADATAATQSKTLTVRPYFQLNQGPYPQDKPLQNTVRYTANQLSAIRSGMNPGLTMVVGPPGTGKTDVAVQIIANLYHNHPAQKILIVTHSNAALNDLFEKIMQRDIHPRHLLRLGTGELVLRELLAESGAKGSGRGQGEGFNKEGRVNWCLERRAYLLNEVQRLSQSMGMYGDVGYTCETAEYFHMDMIRSKMETFHNAVKKNAQQTTAAAAGASDAKSSSTGGASSASSSTTAAVTSTHSVASIFPFSGFFADVPSLFTGDWEQDVETATGCLRHINNIFSELADYRAFELFRSHSLRQDYLLIKQARIVAMTCTHAAMTRGNLVDLGFHYDSIIMEEAGQILEVETLIPMLLQNSDSTTQDAAGNNRLKRVVLLGDHHQLPPIVKHHAFQRFSHFDQSLFSRFIRLGVPHIFLNQQGRARPEIAALYSWRYQQTETQTLLNLPRVLQNKEYLTSNAAFIHNLQWIDVEAYQGRGEYCPTPFFYQNLGEAEYVVAVYQYMRLMGYPASKISILTTYNGQKHLITDILKQRCNNALFGMPFAVSTVDKYQGSQNDYILLSMVRTEQIGHIRDVRRLTVALSRARLGLYVFGRKQLFEKLHQHEWKIPLERFFSHSTKLQLYAGEGYPSKRREGDKIDTQMMYEVQDATQMGALVYQLTAKATSSS